MSICLQNISVRFGEHTVLDSVSGSLVQPGIYGLFGLSGSGKTTWMRVVAKLQKPTTGQCIWKSSSSLVYSFQEPRLFPSLTVQKNLQIVHPDRNPQEILDALDLRNTENLYPEELSGGMKNRVSIARALCKKADIYLFDEPTSGQDASHANLIMQWIKTYTAASICIIASHDIALVSGLSDFCMVIDHAKWQMYDHWKDIPEPIRIRLTNEATYLSEE